MRIIRTAFNIALLFTLVGCFEKNTDNPNKAYQYLTGEKPDKEIQVINGKYWESALAQRIYHVSGINNIFPVSNLISITAYFHGDLQGHENIP